MQLLRRTGVFVIVMMLGSAVSLAAATSRALAGNTQHSSVASRSLALLQGPTTAVVSDSLGDDGPGRDQRGDLVAASVRDDGVTITLGARTRQFDDPSTSPNWVAGGSDQAPPMGPAPETYVGWKLQLNGNTDTTYVLVVQNAGPGGGHRVFGYIFPLDDPRAVVRFCSPTVRWSASDGYLATFASSCLSRPNEVQVSAFMGYTASGTMSDDRATPWTSPVWPPQGYWMVSATGSVSAFGGAARNFGSASTNGVTHLEPTPSRNGYWIVNAAGQVFPFGDAHTYGDAAGLSSGETVTSISATLSGQGYWLFTSRGRVLPFGDAHFYGDMSAATLNGPVVGAAATPTGRGYYMVASDGGIFTFGDAHFAGSMGGRRLNKPITGLVPNLDNRGYWLVASDGGVFAFHAPFRGSMGNTRLNQPIIGMARYGNGYLMVASDGGIFDFSNEPFAGSLGSHPPLVPIVGVGATS